MKIEIIPAMESDAEALVDIQKQAFKRLYDIYKDEGNPYLRGVDEISMWFGRLGWHVYKITVDGVLCGGITVGERKPNEFYLARIYVLPEMQGKGIAVAAIKLCEAKFPNAKRWLLDFPVEESRNRRCYEKAGYVDTGERREQNKGEIILAIYEKLIGDN